jgi:ferredoxin-NADP reductase
MLQLRVEAIKWELPDAATFYLAEMAGKKIRYKAGQFITLVFDHHHEEIRRSYSLSSSPAEELLSITVKRIANGEISRYLLAKIKPGDILNAVEPAGRFVITDFEKEKDIFLLAAGSGIVPMFSQLKALLAYPHKGNITLIYSNQNNESILFKDDLAALAEQHPGRLKIIHLLSSEGKRLTNQSLEKLVNENAKFSQDSAEFYTCGPFEYMRMIRLTLLYMGISAGQIRKENFVLETIPVSTIPMNYPPKTVRVHFNGEIYDFVAGENQSILQAALQNNIPLPYSCRVGDCSTCAAICKSGKVEMVKNNVLTDADLAAGWILTCTGHPVTDDVFIEY